MAATMRSLTSPVIAPLYSPTQARSDCNASRSLCAIALAVSAGVCSAGRMGTVAAVFGLTLAVGLPPAVGLVLALAGAVIWACADASWTARINIAASIDLMTNPVEVIEAAIMKHICLVSNNRERFMGRRGRDDVERR